MSFESEVLALNPLLFWRCKDVSGSQITDYSGNDFHGEVVFGSVTIGAQSLIETDVDARSVYTPGGFANNIAEIASPPSELLFTGNFSIGCFIIHEPQSGFQYLLARGGSAGSTSSGLHFYTSGNTTRTLFGSFVTWDGATATVVQVQAGTTHLNNANYFFVLTRNGSVVRLYRNGFLVGENATADTNPLKLPVSNPLRFGSGGNNLGPLKGYGAELMIFDYALSASEVLQVYESSKATLPLRATIVINLGLELNTDQIVPVDLGFPHNYSQTFGHGQIPIVEELEYKTNINKSEPDYEQRINARPHGPLRTLEYHFSPTAGAARARLQGHLYTPAQFYCVPVWSDVGTTTAQANAGASTIECDTTKRDYEELSYCGVCADPQDPNSYQFFQIVSGGVADAALTLSSTVGTTIPAGSYVFPARVASLSEDNFAVHSFAADHEDTILRFEIIEGELSTRRITAYTPTTTYLSTEVFTLETAKVSFLDDRPFDVARRIQARGRDYQYASDTGSPQSFPVRFLLKDRAALSEFYGWLDQRSGKMNPVWISSKETDYVALARPTSTTLTVRKAGFPFHHGRRHLEILKTDGTYSRLRLTGIKDNLDNTETLTASTSFPSFSTISRVSFLKYCTLGADLIRIQHHKGNIAECGLSFRELLTSPQ